MTQIAADGAIERPLAHFATEERVSKRKRGVALSLRSAAVKGVIENGTPAFCGLVDLRDCRAEVLNDGGGERWEQAGVQAGHLLLDGLTYRDLDDVYDGQETGALIARSDAASRRLCWLTMHYPGHAATPDSFVPQPYEQLAAIFAAEGNERGRRQVLVARRDLQRRHGRLSRFERLIGWLLKLTSNHGYSPARAVGVMAVYIRAGGVGR